MSECGTNDSYFLSFLKPLQNLTKLDLSGNEFEASLQFKAFENQTNLKELRLSDTSMSNFSLNGYFIKQIEKS